AVGMRRCPIVGRRRSLHPLLGSPECDTREAPEIGCHAPSCLAERRADSTPALFRVVALAALFLLDRRCAEPHRQRFDGLPEQADNPLREISRLAFCPAFRCLTGGGIIASVLALGRGLPRCSARFPPGAAPRRLFSRPCCR